MCYKFYFLFIKVSKSANHYSGFKVFPVSVFSQTFLCCIMNSYFCLVGTLSRLLIFLVLELISIYLRIYFGYKSYTLHLSWHLVEQVNLCIDLCAKKLLLRKQKLLRKNLSINLNVFGHSL